MATAPGDPDSAFPPLPVESRVFVEDVIPALFVDLDLTVEESALELRAGIVLTGESGGEWTLHFIDGELGIEPSRALDCDLTLVQRVEDWRAALWGGRPAFVADAIRRLLQAGSAARVERSAPFSFLPDPRTLDELRKLQGLLEVRVEQSAADCDAEGGLARSGSPAGDWRLGIRLGPGPIPGAPDATISLGASQAEAIHQGRLHPLEALMTGELRLEGDLGLILQVQAIAMRAALPR